MTLPAGQRHAALDPARDTIWILTYPDRFIAPDTQEALLTRFDFRTGGSRDYSIVGPSHALSVGAGIAVDGAGIVWLGFGHRIIRIDPTDGKTSEWALPPAPSTGVIAQDPALDGEIRDLAIDQEGAIWVAAYSVQSVYRFDPTIEHWQAFSIAPLVPDRTTTVVSVAKGEIALNGAVPIGSSIRDPGRDYTPNLAVVDAGKGTSRLVGARAQFLAPRSRPDGSLVFFDEAGHSGTVSPTGGNATSKGPAVSRIDAAVPIAIDNSGNAWLLTVSDTLVQFDVGTGVVSQYRYPLRSVTVPSDTGGNYVGAAGGELEPGKTYSSWPAIQQLVPDRDGNVWVISASGNASTDAPGGYPAVVELRTTG